MAPERTATPALLWRLHRDGPASGRVSSTPGGHLGMRGESPHVLRDNTFHKEELTVRTMLHVTIPVEQGNKAIKDGSLAKTLQAFMDEHKPEAAYFFPHQGMRSAFFVFDMKDTTDIPRIAEPMFINLNASIEAAPAMNVDDLKAGLGKFKL